MLLIICLCLLHPDSVTSALQYIHASLTSYFPSIGSPIADSMSATTSSFLILSYGQSVHWHYKQPKLASRMQSLCKRRSPKSINRRPRGGSVCTECLLVPNSGISARWNASWAQGSALGMLSCEDISIGASIDRESEARQPSYLTTEAKGCTHCTDVPER